MAFVSCTQPPRKEPATAISDIGAHYRKGLTPSDSASAKALVVSFMELVQKEKHADAVATLYALNAKDPYLAPELLDNEAMEDVLDMMKKVKVQSYRIKSMEFVSAVNNPTKCEITAELSGNKVPVKLTWVLNPINYMGRWLLCFAEK
jgi:hypothetical protein